MPKGKMLKTKIKEAVLEASCIAEAVKLGEAKAEQKLHDKKPITDSARQHIGKMIDRIDPLEAAAIGACTWAVHEVIMATAPLIAGIGTKLVQDVKSLGTLEGWRDIAFTYIDPLGLYKSAFNAVTGTPSNNLDLDIAPNPIVRNSPIIQEMYQKDSDARAWWDWRFWVISFLVAFFLVRYGAEILKAGVDLAKSVPNVLSMLGFIAL
jgi:hypothetical protein